MKTKNKEKKVLRDTKKAVKEVFSFKVNPNKPIENKDLVKGRR